MEAHKKLEDTAGSHQEAEAAAMIALEETRENLALGSSNLKAVNEASSVTVNTKSLNPGSGAEPQTFNFSPKTVRSVSDKLVFYSPLLQHGPRRKMLDALVDVKVNEIKKDFLEVIRTQSLKLLEATKNLSTDQRRVLLRSKISSLAKSFGVGNCEEMATVAFLNLIKNNYNGKIEFVACRGIDHVFVVLNRPADSDPKSWKTWGSNTIILDPWINKIFNADEFIKVWKNNTLRLNPYDLETFVKFDESSFRASANPQSTRRRANSNS